MTKNFPPNVNPMLFSLSAVLVGMILIDDFNVNEQNSIANWLMLVGQFLETNAAQQQLIESRLQSAEAAAAAEEDSEENNDDNDQEENGTDSTSSNENGENVAEEASDDNQTCSNRKEDKTRSDIDFLLEAVTIMQREIEKLKQSTFP